jgi:hypothetical protein
MTIVANFYAGPGSGKSTVCAHAFAELKWLGINCEMATEYAKDKVWEGSLSVLDNQLYIFGKQYHRLFRLQDKVDVILTDSPLLLSLVYGYTMPIQFVELVTQMYNSFRNIDIFLLRKKGYNPAGRVQTEKKSKELDGAILKVLTSYAPHFHTVEAVRESVSSIVELVRTVLRHEQDNVQTSFPTL